MMNRADEVFALFVGANPVADVTTVVGSDRRPVELFLRQIEGKVDMQTQDRPIQLEPPPKPPARRRWLVPALLGATAVIAAVVVAVVLLAGDDPARDVAEGDSALGSTESLVQAFNRGDYQAYQASFAPDASVSAGGYWRFLALHTGPVPEVAPASFGLQVEAECAENSPTQVYCTLVQRGGLFERIGIEMSADMSVIFDGEGAISVQNVSMVTDFHQPAAFAVAFGRWLRDSHPDVFEATYNTVLPEPVATDVIGTLETRAQWAAVLDEFLAQSDTYPLDGQ